MIQSCQKYLDILCRTLPERSVGSEGNRQATKFFLELMSSHNWEVEASSFEAMDWEENGADLAIGNQKFEVYPSTYSLGCRLEGELMAAGSYQELQASECTGKVLLLYDYLSREQLMPKNFVFYNPEEHKRIIATLEEKNPAAIIAATSRNAALAGGVYPFPLIEDGDFNIPSVFLTEEEGQRLFSMVGKMVSLKSQARRIPGTGYNVIARKGEDTKRRVVITAHIDAKKGTPGAIDNATGVIVLLLLAELLEDYSGQTMIELVALNGEDYFTAPGQMIYLSQNQGRFREILLNINIDGAGYHKGLSAFSFFR